MVSTGGVEPLYTNLLQVNAVPLPAFCTGLYNISHAYHKQDSVSPVALELLKCYCDLRPLNRVLSHLGPERCTSSIG